MKWKWFLIAAIAVVVAGVVWLQGGEARRARIFAMTDCGDPPPEWVGTKWGFVSRQGKEVIQLQYGMAWGFHDGIARVAIMEEYGPGKLRHPWVQSSGFIDKTGKFVIPMADGFYGEFHDGLATAYVKGDPPGESSLDREYGYIDRTGRFAIQPQYGYASDFSEGLASFAMGDSYHTRSGLVDTKGRVVLKPTYYGIREFSEGRAIVNLAEDIGCEGPYGYIDRTGKLITSEKLGFVEDFKDGLGTVGVGKDGVSLTAYVDKDGWILPEPPNRKSNRIRWNYDVMYDGPRTRKIDWSKLKRLFERNPMTGELKLAEARDRAHERLMMSKRPRFDRVGEFSEGLASIQAPPGGKFGFIDRSEKTVIQPKFGQARGFKGGIAAAQVGQKWGFIDKSGKFVIAPKYAWVSDFSEGLAAVCTGRDALRDPPTGY